MKVVCFIEDGYARAKGVANDATEDLYEFGVDLGPPDLSSLPISDKALKGLYQALVEQNMYQAPLLMGRRKQLIELLNNLKMDNGLLRDILGIFQRDFYGE